MHQLVVVVTDDVQDNSDISYNVVVSENDSTIHDGYTVNVTGGIVEDGTGSLNTCYGPRCLQIYHPGCEGCFPHK